MSKKWTKWLPWSGHTVIADERYKILFENGNVTKTTGMKIIQIGYDDFNVITHYKRLKKNVKAEEARNEMESARHHPTQHPRCPNPVETKASQIHDEIESLKSRPESRRGPFVITDEDIDRTSKLSPKFSEPKTEPEQVQSFPLYIDHIAAVLLNEVLKGTATPQQEAQIRSLLGASVLTHTRKNP